MSSPLQQDTAVHRTDHEDIGRDTLSECKYTYLYMYWQDVLHECVLSSNVIRMTVINTTVLFVS